LKREINACWESRADITPTTQGAPKIQILEILKLLPRTNCRQCGEPTCMVFAVRMAEGVKGTGDCPSLEVGAKEHLQDYMRKFQFDE
jgi:ArsR family metal-binding transcriptional regulator